MNSTTRAGFSWRDEISSKWGYGISHALHDLNNNSDGMLKVARWMLASSRLISWVNPSMGEVLGKFERTHEGVKDWYYACMIFQSSNDLFKQIESKTFNWTDTSITLLQTLGNCFEVAKFLKKHEVCAFSRFHDAALRLSSITLFSYGDSSVHLPNLTVGLCKDICTISWSAIDLWKCMQKYEKDKGLSLELFLKVTGSTGRIVLCCFGRFYGDQPWFIVASFVVQSAAILGTSLKNKKSYDKSFDDSVTAGAA